MKLATERFNHLNVPINPSHIAKEYPDPPNMFIGFGMDASGDNPHSESICTSQTKNDIFYKYCESDKGESIRLKSYGNVIMEYKPWGGERSIVACGGVKDGVVTKNCSAINPNSNFWEEAPFELQSERLFPGTYRVV